MLKLADNLELPLDFMTERTAFLARTGAGKSGGMRVLLEQIFDAGQFSIFIDPKGDAWGIRAAGKKAGKPVLIMGGDHADVPLEASSGKVVAEFLVRERVTTVLDISDFSTPEMWRFVAEFTKTLYKLNREALLLFIDEADMLAGQTYFDPHCLHGIQLIQNKGRSRGFGVVVATQRPQILNKTVLNASGTLIAMQMIGDDALKIVKSWLMQSGTKEAAAAILAEIPTLQIREAFVYSPQILGIEPRRIRFAEFQTFDSMRTPKPGEARQTPKSVADIDLEGVQRDMAATIEKAKSEDPALLRKQIATLEREKATLEKARNAAPAANTEPVQVEVPIPVLDEAKLAELTVEIQGWAHDIDQIVTNVKASFDQLHLLRTGSVTKLLADLRNAKPVLPAGTAPNIFDRPKPKAPQTLQSRPESTQNLKSHAVSNVGDVTIVAREQKVLDAIAMLSMLNPAADPSRSNVAFFSGYADNSTFRNILGRLSGLGLISYPSPGRLALTETGEPLADAGGVPIRTLDDLHQAWLNKLVAREQLVLNQLLPIYPDSMKRTDLAIACGYEDNSTFRNILGKLSGLGIIEYPQSGWVKATSVMFPEGLN